MAKAKSKREIKRPQDANDPISILREAWEQGHSILAAQLNTVLVHVGLSIKAGEPESEISLEQTAAHFWDIAATVRLDHPELKWLRPNRVSLWTAGYVDALSEYQATGKETAGRLFYVNHNRFPSLDEELKAICGSLQCRLAKGAPALPKAAWKRYIVDPIREYAASWRNGFDELASAVETTDDLVPAKPVWTNRFRSLSEFKAFLKRNNHITTKSRGRRLLVDAAAVIKAHERERNVKLNAESDAVDALLDKAAADFDEIEQRKQAAHAQKVAADKRR